MLCVLSFARTSSLLYFSICGLTSTCIRFYCRQSLSASRCVCILQAPTNKVWILTSRKCFFFLYFLQPGTKNLTDILLVTCALPAVLLVATALPKKSQLTVFSQPDTKACSTNCQTIPIPLMGTICCQDFWELWSIVNGKTRFKP